MAVGLGATLTTFIPNTVINSAQVNSNFQALNNAGSPTFNKVTLAVGAVTRVSKFTGSGSGTFAHGLGKIPDVVLMNSTSSGNTQSFEYHSADATNVIMTASGASQTWIAFAIAFS